MEKILKAYQQLRSGIYFIESLPIVGVNRLFRLANSHYKVSKADIEYLTVKVDELFQFDVRNIDEGVYPLSVLTPKSPVQHFKILGKVYADTFRILYRKFFKQTKAFSKPAMKLMADLPEYYKRNFHFQTDGYMSTDSADIYDHQVEILFKGTSQAMRRLYLKDMKAHFEKAGVTRPHILEIGVGTGSATEYLLRTFPDAKITVLDLSPAYLKKAQSNLKNFTNKMDYVQGAGESLPFQDESFDAVFSVYLFHELPFEVREKVIAESLRVLRPSGYLGVIDSLQRDDDAPLNWAIEEFPKDFHEPFYKNYIEHPMEDIVAALPATLLKKRIGFLTKALSYSKS